MVNPHNKTTARPTHQRGSCWPWSSPTLIARLWCAALAAILVLGLWRLGLANGVAERVGGDKLKGNSTYATGGVLPRPSHPAANPHAIRSGAAAWVSRFWDRGYSEPFPVLTSDAAKIMGERVYLEVGAGKHMLFPELHRRNTAAHIISPTVVELAAHPAILDRVAALLGNDIMLFEATLAVRAAGVVHRFHSDVSFLSCAPSDAVAVWVALRGVTPATSLEVVPYSHLVNATAQGLLAGIQGVTGSLSKNQLGVHASAAAAVREFMAAQQGLPPGSESGVVPVATGNGDAVIFHGHTWHGSANTEEVGGGGKPRLALALRYMKTSCVLRLADINPPFAPLTMLPPVILLRGEVPVDSLEQNNVFSYVPNTLRKLQRRGKALSTHIDSQLHHRYARVEELVTSQAIEIPVPLTTPTVYSHTMPRAVVSGTASDAPGSAERGFPPMLTRSLAYLRSHWSYQRQYDMPHQPHHHQRHEMVILFSGEMRVTQLTLEGSMVRETLLRRKGDIAVYPPLAWHTITALSNPGAFYLCLFYIPAEGGSNASTATPGATVEVPDASVDGHEGDAAKAAESTENGLVYPYLVPESQPSIMYQNAVVTVYSVRLQGKQADRSAPQAVAFDRVVVCLEGTLSLHNVKTPMAATHVALIPVGSPMQIRNAGTSEEVAEYLVFDFHGVQDR